jgi:hypothetical protein
VTWLANEIGWKTWFHRSSGGWLPQAQATPGARQNADPEALDRLSDGNPSDRQAGPNGSRPSKPAAVQAQRSTAGNDEVVVFRGNPEAEPRQRATATADSSSEDN